MFAVAVEGYRNVSPGFLVLSLPGFFTAQLAPTLLKHSPPLVLRTHTQTAQLPATSQTQVSEEEVRTSRIMTIFAHSQWAGLVLVSVSVKQVWFEVRTCHFEARAPFTTEGAIQVVGVRHGQHTLCEQNALKYLYVQVFHDISLTGQDFQVAGY